MAKPTQVEGLSAQTPLAEAARLLTAARLADARRYVELVERDCDEVEAVHDLRVATRRLRAALGLCGSALDGEAREAKRLQDALGAVRDAQLQIAWLGEALLSATEPPGGRARQRDALAALIEHRQDDLRRAEKRLLEALQRWRETEPRLLGALETLDRKGKLGGHRVRARLRRRLKTLRERMRDADASLRADVAHALRIAVKKLRYDAELVQPALQQQVTAVLEAVEPLQELLGNLHDADVRLEFLEEAAARWPDTRDGVEDLQISELTRRGQLGHELAGRLAQWRDDDKAKKLRALFR
jgi:CHAD domain-containing protein